MQDKTPLQQAIEYVEVQMKKWRRTDSIDSPIYTAYGIVRDRLVIMLRDEKEFVGKVWNAGFRKGWQEGENRDEPYDDPALSKPEFLNQLYPKS